ncbi:hypothetical protein C7M84_017586 [Penaeus vannamei]|uniref:Uncharacterized protein n=1 Tax=Penaeus vannamei TaxID=6689 RepID=A0A3R7PWY7_PENVA|nr:hypothetical protein C7M84_017586 [Penaeus vannamei]
MKSRAQRPRLEARASGVRSVTGRESQRIPAITGDCRNRLICESRLQLLNIVPCIPTACRQIECQAGRPIRLWWVWVYLNFRTLNNCLKLYFLSLSSSFLFSLFSQLYASTSPPAYPLHPLLLLLPPPPLLFFFSPPLLIFLPFFLSFSSFIPPVLRSPSFSFLLYPPIPSSPFPFFPHPIPTLPFPTLPFLSPSSHSTHPLILPLPFTTPLHRSILSPYSNPPLHPSFLSHTIPIPPSSHSSSFPSPSFHLFHHPSPLLPPLILLPPLPFHPSPPTPPSPSLQPPPSPYHPFLPFLQPPPSSLSPPPPFPLSNPLLPLTLHPPPSFPSPPPSFPLSNPSFPPPPLSSPSPTSSFPLSIPSFPPPSSPPHPPTPAQQSQKIDDQKLITPRKGS